MCLYLLQVTAAISKRAQTVEIKYRNPCGGPIAHLVVDATGLKFYCEGEWKMRKHGKEKRRTWRKLHLAIDAQTHEVIAAEVSMVNVVTLLWIKSEVLPTLLNPIRRKIASVSTDGAYDTKDCHKRAVNPPLLRGKCGLLGGWSS
jgi:hypothetical protein